MHFDQRTQAARRSVGLSTADVRAASAAVVEATAEEAAALAAFVDGLEVVFADVDLAHSSTAFPEHGLEYVDLHTHAADRRGYVTFDGWDVPVEDGRGLGDDDVELGLGPTVHDRVRYAATRQHR
jgi:hypothetical protein